ncbi:hypothetical protein GCM10027030_26800 [Luteococcus sediminum]
MGVRVVVADDGCGFDPSTIPADRLGVLGSIGRRMTDAGGAAVMHTSPGQGTSVVLTWPHAGPEDPRRAWTVAPDDLSRPLLVRTALPGLAAGLVMTLLMAPRSASPALALMAGLVSVLLGLQAMRVLRRSPMNRMLFATLCAAAVLGWAVNLWLVPQSPRIDYALWMAWISSTLVHLMVLSLSLNLGTVVASGWMLLQATMMLLRYRDPGLLWELSSLLTAGAGDIAVTLLVLLSVRTVAEQASGALQRASRLRMATGGLDPAEPSVRETAWLMDSSLRDELLLGPSPAPLLRVPVPSSTSAHTGSDITDTAAMHV